MTTTTPWTGWIRSVPGGKWQPVCHALTWQGCMDLLIRHRGETESVEKVVLPSGKHPDRRRKPR